MSAISPSAVSVQAKAEKALVTGEELLAMGDIGPSELIEGEIVKMTPTGEKHGTIEVNLGGEIRTFVRQHRLGRVSVGEVGLYIRRNPDTVRGADIVFISNERLGKRGTSGFIDVAPDLVVEIMSPDDRWSEVMKKLGEYFSIGVRWVWVVDPDTESVYTYRSLTDVHHLTQTETLSGDDVLPGFTIGVAELFVD